MRKLVKLIIATNIMFSIPALSQVSDSRGEAKRLLERLSSTKVALDHPLIVEIEARIKAGDLVGAAAIAQRHENFLNITVKQMALKMSTRELTLDLPLNDFAASFVGVTRDQTDARELLFGNFHYRASDQAISEAAARGVTIRQAPADFTVSNNHYGDLDNPVNQINIGQALTRVNGQILRGADDNTTIVNPDPAGVITSRAFMTAHALAGTSRRPVQFAVQEFLCVPIGEWADTSASDRRIGRDIDRFPGTDHMKFLTTCKGCHTVMDGFRGAFAYWDSSGSRYSVVGTTVRPKMNQNGTVWATGYVTTDNSFVNNARGPANAELFGWRGTVQGGSGVGQFGRMLADSKRFSQCMVKRVYEAVCKQEIVAKYNLPFLKQYAAQFEGSGYNLNKLFQQVAVSDLCLGK